MRVHPIRVSFEVARRACKHASLAAVLARGNGSQRDRWQSFGPESWITNCNHCYFFREHSYSSSPSQFTSPKNFAQHSLLFFYAIRCYTTLEVVNVLIGNEFLVIAMHSHFWYCVVFKDFNSDIVMFCFIIISSYCIHAGYRISGGK